MYANRKLNPAHKAWKTRRSPKYKRKKAAEKAKATRHKTGGHSKKTQALKYEVFSHYSKGKPKCACCREDASLDFLTIDHIKGRKLGKNKVDNRRGSSLYSYLKRNDYPKGYQVLCWNCNAAKFVYLVCPHKRKRH